MNGLFLLCALLFLCALALEATAILFIAWRITHKYRKNAALRHLTWLIAFITLLLIPAVAVVMPIHIHVRIPLPVAFKALPTKPLAPYPSKAIAEARNHPPLAQETFPLVPKPIQGNESSVASQHYGNETPGMLDLYRLWLLGVVTVILQAVFAIYGIEQMRHHSEAGAFPSLDLSDLVVRVGLKRPWELRVSITSTPSTAMTWGCLRPVVLLPQDALFWSRERLEAVLLHELAHVRRRDSLSQLLSLCVCAIYWFHPGVWLCARAMREAAEDAADDAVLRAGVKPSVYAAELLQFAAQLGSDQQSFARIGVSIMKRSKIEARIKSIVDPSSHRREATPSETRKAVGFGAVILLVLSSLRPSVSSAQAQYGAPNGAIAGDVPYTVPQAARSSDLGTIPVNAPRRASTGNTAEVSLQRHRNTGKASWSNFPLANADADEMARYRQWTLALEDMQRGVGNAHGKGKADEEAAQKHTADIKAAHDAATAARVMAKADSAQALRREGDGHRLPTGGLR